MGGEVMQDTLVPMPYILLPGGDYPISTEGITNEVPSNRPFLRHAGGVQRAYKAIQTTYNFRSDVDFLNNNKVPVVVLRRGNARVAVVPAYQGRVMTSSADGDTGTSYGWMHRDLIASGVVHPHINAFGGEDRFCLGPEGGQFGLFFKAPFAIDYEHWQSPTPLDTEPFKVEETTQNSVLLHKTMHLVNRAGTPFDLEVARVVELRDPAIVLSGLGFNGLPEHVKAVAFTTTNRIKNTGKTAWSPSTGLLSIWILGMYRAKPKTTIVIPYQRGDNNAIGDVYHDNYYGGRKLGPDRLKDDQEDTIFFKGDAKVRSKVGIPPKRATNLMGTYDPDTHTLTIVTFSPLSNSAPYVNSKWAKQFAQDGPNSPFGGDVASAYNDGPPKTGGKQLGPFYQLESSSPALALKPGETASHQVTTIHLQGTPEDLDGVAAALLHRGIDKIENAFVRHQPAAIE